MKNIPLEYNFKEEVLDFIISKIQLGIIPKQEDIVQDFSYTKHSLLNEDKKNEIHFILKRLTNIEYLFFLIDIKGIEEAKFLGAKNLLLKTSELNYQRESKLSEKEFYIICHSILHLYKQELNSKNPFNSFSIQINSTPVRCTIFYPTVKVKSTPYLVLRFFKKNTPKLSSFCKNNDQIELIKNIILEKKNFLISGGTGAGKTSFLQSILKETNARNDQLCLIEDLKELPHINDQTIHLASSEIYQPLEELINWTLRITPERIILGEVRSKEVVSFLNILNTGHPGTITTIHSNSALEAIERMAFLVSLYGDRLKVDMVNLKKYISGLVHYVIHIQDKNIYEIIKIKGTANNGALYYDYI